MKKLKIIFASEPDMSGNVKALYEYILNNYKDMYELIIVVVNENFILGKESQYNFCLLKNCKHTVSSADIVFDTHGILLNYVSDKQIYVNLGHGNGPKKAGYHLDYGKMSDLDKDYCFMMSKKSSFCTVPSSFWRILFAAQWDMNINRVIPTGLPRNDALFDSNGRKNLKKLLNIDIDKFKKIIFYLPTFRRGINLVESEINEYNTLFVREYSDLKLKKFLIKNNYLLVIKKHPCEQISMKKTNSDNIKYITESSLHEMELSLYDILNGADLLLTDYSSVYIDYLILNRNVIFLNYDKEEYINNRGFLFDNINFWYPGDQVETFSELKNSIVNCFNNPNYNKKERESFIDLIYDKRDNKSSKRIYDFFFNNGKINNNVIKILNDKKLNDSKEIYKRKLKSIPFLKKRKG